MFIFFYFNLHKNKPNKMQASLRIVNIATVSSWQKKLKKKKQEITELQKHWRKGLVCAEEMNCYFKVNLEEMARMWMYTWIILLRRFWRNLATNTYKKNLKEQYKLFVVRSTASIKKRKINIKKNRETTIKKAIGVPWHFKK